MLQHQWSMLGARFRSNSWTCSWDPDTLASSCEAHGMTSTRWSKDAPVLPHVTLIPGPSLVLDPSSQCRSARAALLACRVALLAGPSSLCKHLLLQVQRSQSSGSPEQPGPKHHQCTLRLQGCPAGGPGCVVEVANAQPLAHYGQPHLEHSKRERGAQVWGPPPRADPGGCPAQVQCCCTD